MALVAGKQHERAFLAQLPYFVEPGGVHVHAGVDAIEQAVQQHPHRARGRRVRCGLHLA